MSRAIHVGAFALATLGAVVIAVARADAPAGHYTVLSAAEVKDNRTGLVWARVEESGSFAWTDAKTKCASKGSGYRVPTIRELQSIVDETREPAIDMTVFTDTTGATSGLRWSSTPNVSTAYPPGYAWVVGFLVGDTGVRDGALPTKVRCVR